MIHNAQMVCVKTIHQAQWTVQPIDNCQKDLFESSKAGLFTSCSANKALIVCAIVCA